MKKSGGIVGRTPVEILGSILRIIPKKKSKGRIPLKKILRRNPLKIFGKSQKKLREESLGNSWLGEISRKNSVRCAGKVPP